MTIYLIGEYFFNLPIYSYFASSDINHKFANKFNWEAIVQVRHKIIIAIPNAFNSHFKSYFNVCRKIGLFMK